MKRSFALDQLRSDSSPYDIIIVGGGATGLGAAVDAASRGHKTLLIEQSDFAKGTSSRSTKLVHGGVRYLQQGNVSLVLGALRERGLLYHNAPHLVHNMAFVIPNYKWWEGPFYGIGMKVYDGLAGKLGLSPSRNLSLQETMDIIPTVETEGLTGGVIYHDGQFDDSRLAINLAQSAVECGATVVNYMKCVGLIKERHLVTGVLARDEESGEEFEIKGHAVVNATGIFVDDLRQLDEPEVSEMVAVSQGIHLILPKHFLPGEAAIMVPKTKDGRVMFGVPWHNRIVVGTTDTPLHLKTLEPRALQEERDFIMEHAARYLTQDPTDDDVLSIQAGLRPLVKTGDGANTAALSRDHTILVSQSGLITVTGGKWTTYRKMGEDVVDHAEIVAGIDEKPCQTRNLQIKGWTHALIPEENLQVYGSEASGIREILKEQPNLAAKLHPDLPYQEVEIIWHVRQEMARTLEDVLARRTRALLLNARASISIAPRVATLMADELKWDKLRESREVENYITVARGYDFKDPASTATI